MENLTLEPNICLICRKEDDIVNLFNYHFDHLKKIRHLVHMECADAVRDENCPLRRQSDFSIIKRSGVEVDKNMHKKYHDHLLKLLQTFENNSDSDRVIHVIDGIADNGLKSEKSLNDCAKEIDVKLVLVKIACEKGNISLLKLLIETGVDVNADNEFALRKSAEKDNVEMIKCLVENGADIHADNDCALRTSVNNGHLSAVKYLAEHITKKNNDF